jgi:hypothetical protein
MLTVCLCAAATPAAGGRWGGEGGDRVGRDVTYDGRALVLNGTRRFMFSGEMHYTRSTPEVIVPRYFGVIWWFILLI